MMISMHLEREQFANQLLLLQKKLCDKNEQYEYQTKHSSTLSKALEKMEKSIESKMKEFEKISLTKKAGWVKASITSESLICKFLFCFDFIYWSFIFYYY
jgi:phage shock protein A